jgi:PEGA domain
MMTRRNPFIVVALLAILGAGPVRAQSAPPRASKTQARAPIRAELGKDARHSWDSAIELFEAQDFQGARVEFMRAWELSRNPRVLFNVGVCDKNLRRYARAAAVWRQQLETQSDRLSEDDIRATRAAIAAVEPFISSLTVRANTEGATLFIDNEVVGQTPFLAPIAIDVGHHTLRLRKSGFRDDLKELEVASKKPETVELVLEPVVKTALMEVAVRTPLGATVFVDGVDMGPAPFKGQLPVGRHTIEARAEGFVTARQTSLVRWNQPVRLMFSLSRQRHEGKVRVQASEADAIILVDGRVVGSGSWEGVLPSGGHQLVVRKAGYQTYTSDLALSDDQVRTMTVPLAREQRGASWVWWTLGSVAVVAGGAVATYFVTKPTESAPVTGSWSPGNVPTGAR